jgi:hypothetical protein
MSRQPGITQSFVGPLTAVYTTLKQELGTLRWEGNKCYKFVKYNQGAGSVACIAGDAVYYYAVGGTATTGYADNEVTADRTDGVLAAGIAQAVIAHGGYGWIQIKGPATLTQALTAGADGNNITAVGAGADGALDVAAAVTDGCVGFAFDASGKHIVCNFPF